LVEKYKVVGSIARALMRECVRNGSLKPVESHSRQTLYTPTVQAAEKVVVAETKEVTKKEKVTKKK
jgi:hypothetical protein